MKGNIHERPLPFSFFSLLPSFPITRSSKILTPFEAMTDWKAIRGFPQCYLVINWMPGIYAKAPLFDRRAWRDTREEWPWTRTRALSAATSATCLLGCSLWFEWVVTIKHMITKVINKRTCQVVYNAVLWYKIKATFRSLLSLGPMVTWFKLYWFELVLRDTALVRSPVREEFSANLWD